MLVFDHKSEFVQKRNALIDATVKQAIAAKYNNKVKPISFELFDLVIHKSNIGGRNSR